MNVFQACVNMLERVRPSPYPGTSYWHLKHVVYFVQPFFLLLLNYVAQTAKCTLYHVSALALEFVISGDFFARTYYIHTTLNYLDAEKECSIR